MTRFAYRAVTATGETVSGEMDVADKDAVIARLHELGQTPLSIAQASSNWLTDALNKDVLALGGLTQKDVLALTRSLATLLDAGIDLDRALEMTRDLEAKGKKQAILDGLLTNVREGQSFTDALEKYPSEFSLFYRNMIRAGELGAALVPVLNRLADYLEQSQKLKTNLRSALIYPAFLITASLGAVLILLTVVVPTFQPIFEGAGAALPASTAIVIAVGSFFQSYWWAVCLGLVLCSIAFMALHNTPRGRLWWQDLALRVPVFGTIWLQSATSRVSRTLGTLLENGVALPQAMTLARDVAGNAAIAQEIDRATEDVQMGKGLAAPLKAGGLFPSLAIQLIEVGEESGKLEGMLHRIAAIYEEETQTATARMMSLLTPILTLVIGGLIAFIVSSILFALFSINELAR